MYRAHDGTRRKAARIAGFTLIELMIVVAVLGVLTTIAVPVYRQYVERARRTEAKTALLRLQANQERFYLQNNTFTNDLDALGFANGCSEHCVYTIDFSVAPDTQGYTARARPTVGGGTNGADQTGDEECQWFTIDARTIADAGPDPDDRCW
jgi:type IV pilus assembly protein PilE